MLKKDCTLLSGGTVLGKGAFGEVKKITKNNKSYAIKKLKIGESFVDSTIGGFYKHPNIINVYGFLTKYDCKGQKDGFESIIMDAAAMSLDKAIKKKVITDPNKLLPICDALLFLESYGVIYTDLKVENILVSPQNTLLLGDLGGITFMDRQMKAPYSHVSTPGYTQPDKNFVGPATPAYVIVIIYAEIAQQELFDTSDPKTEEKLLKEQLAFLSKTKTKKDDFGRYVEMVIHYLKNYRTKIVVDNTTVTGRDMIQLLSLQTFMKPKHGKLTPQPTVSTSVKKYLLHFKTMAAKHKNMSMFSLVSILHNMHVLSTKLKNFDNNTIDILFYIEAKLIGDPAIKVKLEDLAFVATTMEGVFRPVNIMNYAKSLEDLDMLFHDEYLQVLKTKTEPLVSYIKDDRSALLRLI